MKISFILLMFIFIFGSVQSQSVGIGTNTPAASAQLDVSSTSKGFLLPRMTIAQRNAISGPVTGIMIWCIDCNQLQVYDGAVWQNIAGPKAIFPSVTICSQVWMNKNLDVANYSNGDPIAKVTDNAAWAALTTGAYCYYNNDSATYAVTYGKLYNWYAVNDPRGLAPAGWRIPSEAEWSTLATCLGGGAGGPMKEAGTSHWLSPNTGASNSSGFTALPGGYRVNSGTFNGNGNYCLLWSSTGNLTADALNRSLNYDDVNFNNASTNRPFGFSVRCLRD